MQVGEDLFHLKFPEGEVLQVPKKKLLLCVELFETFIDEPFQESASRQITFRDLTKRKFEAVLHYKDLTLNVLKNLGIKVGLTKGFAGYPDMLLPRDGDKAVAETQWIGVKKGGLLPKSRNCKTYDGYMECVKKEGLDALFVLEYALAEILLHAEGREPLFGNDKKGRWIWGFCKDDLIEGKYVNVVGRCGPAGPYVSRCQPDRDDIGILGVLRK